MRRLRRQYVTTPQRTATAAPAAQTPKTSFGQRGAAGAVGSVGAGSGVGATCVPSGVASGVPPVGGITWSALGRGREEDRTNCAADPSATPWGTRPTGRETLTGQAMRKSTTSHSPQISARGSL